MNKKNVIFLVTGLGIGFVAGAVADAYSEEVENAVHTVLVKLHLKKDEPEEDISEEPLEEIEDEEDEQPERRVVNSSDPLTFEKPDPRDILKYKAQTQAYADAFNGGVNPVKEAKDIPIHRNKNGALVIPDDSDIHALMNSVDDDGNDLHIENLSDAAEEAVTENETMDEDSMFEFITMKDYEEDNGFDKINLIYFPEEDVLVASQKEEPVNPLYLIGNDAYNDLLRQDGEPSIIVRNNAVGADILVNVNFDEGYYDWIQSE